MSDWTTRISSDTCQVKSSEQQENGSFSAGDEPCKAFEEDGFCMKGSQCTFKHDHAITNVNYIEFLFEYETITTSGNNSNDVSLSKKAKKIQQVIHTSQKPKIAPKSKKIKLTENIKDETTTPLTQLTEEPFEIPVEYEKVNFEKPLIPFDFSYHTPTHVRQKMLEDLIEIHSKITNNKKKAIVLSFQKEKEFYTGSFDKMSYTRQFTRFKKAQAPTSSSQTVSTQGNQEARK
ncbi:hypothetical protein C9374_000851 [Naegleria lovaniensis]|uniref:C3H1-type domain-containing protein n=1 Tax=Naegleria lovaniensis TaxID=51637 RepID=A0AA88KNV3_NAELO|nr:uncharacterized protein C9374_000851 [Naegleria lovaniensis]KAG2388001.1 hypothetical protein C9374_000851 [Naegleria lovaniensis]